MDLLDKKLLTLLQSDFPLTTKPYLSLAKKLDTSEKDVLDRIVDLKNQGIIRQISAIFDSMSIGYQSTLLAFKVKPENLVTVAQAISANPGVSHNYQRVGKYNLWFTLTLPVRKNLYDEAETMVKAANVSDWLFLPAIKTFKIRFQLDLTEGNAKNTVAAKPEKKRVVAKPVKVSQKFIRQLQQDLPVKPRPYQDIAKALKLSEAGVVAKIKEYTEIGAIRRIAAVLRQKKAGFVANVMVAWAPKDEYKEALAECAIKQQRISHCYERPSSRKWPYSIYTMVHGKTKVECAKVVSDVAKQSGVKKFCLLPTIYEFKKIRVQYYA